MLDFLGIGAQKAGTTWIYEQLLRHPEIAFPAGKEVHFFDQHADRGAAWYEALFPENTTKKQGEITPAYAFLEKAAIEEIYSLTPDVKLFYSLRHPVERAWSGAMMALRRAEMTVEEASDQWFLDHFTSQGSRNRGDYVSCVENWLTVFPQSSLFVMNFNQIITQPRLVLQQLAEHLDIDPCFYDDVSDDILQQKVYANNLSYPNRPRLHKKLQKIYKPAITTGMKHPVLGKIYQQFNEAK